MKIKKYKLQMLFIFCFFIFLTQINIYAQTSENFSIHAIIPNNQIDKKKTYFDLRMEKGSKQTVQIVIDNSWTEDTTFVIQLNSATTGRNGLIVYENTSERDENLKISIEDIAKAKETEVIVPAFGSRTVDIELEMPNEKVKGEILGGIVVSKKRDENVQSENEVLLVNTITYVIGLRIIENDEIIAPDFELVSITPDLINYRTAIVATIRNKVPLIVKNLDVEAYVYKYGSNDIINQLSLKNVEMAPISKGNFVIDWNDMELKKGDYELKMTLNHDGKEWSFDEKFSIKDEVNILNSEAVKLARDFTWLYILGGVILLFFVALLGYNIGKISKKIS